MAEFEKTCHLELEPEVTILQNGRRRVTRRFELGKNNNIDDVIFRAYGDADPGEITSCTTGYANLKLVAQAVQPQQGKKASVLVQVFETLTSTWAKETDDVVDYELNGLKRSTQTLVALPGTDYETYVVGTSTLAGPPVQYLAAKNAVETDGLTRLSLVYLEGGLVDATKTFDVDEGVLYVTFRSFAVKAVPTCLKAGSNLNDDPSVAFQGGAAANLFRDRIENVAGYRIFTVTVMMKLDGSALTASNTVHSYQRWVQFGKPGELSLSFDGVTAYPGNERWVKVLVEEVLTTDSTVDDTYKPFSVKNWAFFRISYTPEGGGASVVEAKGAANYLADSSVSGTNTDFAGIPVEAVAGVAESDPTPSAFYALDNQIIQSDGQPSFVTDEGIKWYRRIRVTVVGTFGTYLNA